MYRFRKETTLVKFANDKYGIRAGWLQYRYMDADGDWHWNPKYVTLYCHFPEVDARKLMARYHDVGKPASPIPSPTCGRIE